MRGQRTDPQIVARVEAAIAAGESIREVAAKWNLNPKTVQRISARIGEKLSTVVHGEGGDSIGAKLAELVLANAEGMIGIAKIAKDPSYLKTQQAGGLAQLYAALADTTLQLLEAAENAGGQDSPEE